MSHDSSELAVAHCLDSPNAARLVDLCYQLEGSD